MRSRRDVARAAFIGAFCAVVPTMLDRSAGGVISPGFMPQLAPWFGDGSFDEGVAPRFAALCRSGSRLGGALGAAWAAMRDEVSRVLGATIDTGPLGFSSSF